MWEGTQMKVVGRYVPKRLLKSTFIWIYCVFFCIKSMDIELEQWGCLGKSCWLLTNWHFLLLPTSGNIPSSSGNNTPIIKKLPFHHFQLVFCAVKCVKIKNRKIHLKFESGRPIEETLTPNHFWSSTDPIWRRLSCAPKQDMLLLC